MAAIVRPIGVAEGSNEEVVVNEFQLKQQEIVRQALETLVSEGEDIYAEVDRLFGSYNAEGSYQERYTKALDSFKVQLATKNEDRLFARYKHAQKILVAARRMTMSGQMID
ncbi:hypothetical protein [Streptomyces sp. CoH17]|uniref:hypothetical protein n=1 Tax=Streptomyces sp. CoH17 TaxID=2992806 RepID=UPI00226D5A05|nr:hypothetical protein [Streptomyces sp. CoH17]